MKKVKKLEVPVKEKIVTLTRNFTQTNIDWLNEQAERLGYSSQSELINVILDQVRSQGDL